MAEGLEPCSSDPCLSGVKIVDVNADVIQRATRRQTFGLIAQQLGFSIDQIRISLEGLPDRRTPTQRGWTRLSRGFRDELQARIDILTRMRDRLDGCIGCGCLSLTQCALYNAEDRARRQGTGPRYLLGEPE